MNHGELRTEEHSNTKRNTINSKETNTEALRTNKELVSARRVWVGETNARTYKSRCDSKKTHTKVRKYSDLHDQDEKTREGADEGEKKQQVSKLAAGNRWTSRHVCTAGERVVDIFVAITLLVSGYAGVLSQEPAHLYNDSSGPLPVLVADLGLGMQRGKPRRPRDQPVLGMTPAVLEVSTSRNNARFYLSLIQVGSVCFIHSLTTTGTKILAAEMMSCLLPHLPLNRRQCSHYLPCQ